jgi:hypothetical protein
MIRRPAMASRIVRRLLLNASADPGAVVALLPPGMRPELVRGCAVIGICVVELADVRPVGVPRAFGMQSRNAAHRVAVEWGEDGVWRRGVYVIRRDSASPLNVAVGGRLFPGVHHRARVTATDGSNGRVEIDLAAHDGLRMAARLRDADGWQSRLFADVAQASTFFERGSLGLSPRRNGHLEAVELEAERWHVEPMRLDSLSSTLFDQLLPPGSYEPDCALVMRDVRATWRERITPSSWRQPVPSLA